MVAYNRMRREQHRRRLHVIKRRRGCADCVFHVGRAYTRRWASVLVEIARCDVLCHSCHLRRHGASYRGLAKKRA